MTSLRILSRLVFPAILLSQFTSATRILLSSSFRRHQHSDPYIRTGATNALCSFIFVFVATLVVFHTLLNFPNIAAVCSIRIELLIQRERKKRLFNDTSISKMIMLIHAYI